MAAGEMFSQSLAPKSAPITAIRRCASHWLSSLVSFSPGKRKNGVSCAFSAGVPEARAPWAASKPWVISASAWATVSRRRLSGWLKVWVPMKWPAAASCRTSSG